MKFIKLITKLNSFLVNLINFVIILAIYFFGVGLSFIVYKLSTKKSEKGWIKLEQKKENYERQI